MKLKNKKTGEIKDVVVYKTKKQPLTEGIDYQGQFNSLAELNEEWEDVEEPKKYWYIDCFGDVQVMFGESKTYIICRKLIGNYFETEEEAKEAVEKLKAWKRLKENGLSFESWDGYVDTGDEFDSGNHFECCGFVNARGQFLKSFDKYTQFKADLDLLFGGKE